MSRDADAKNVKLFDRRTVERNIKKGLITRKDYEKHLKALADVTDKGTHGAEEPAAPSGGDGGSADDAGHESPTNSHN